MEGKQRLSSSTKKKFLLQSVVVVLPQIRFPHPLFPRQVLPALQASYSLSMYTGKMGTAMIPKVVSNMLCCVQVVAMGEVLMLAKRLGLDLGTFWHAIRCSAGNSFLWETAGPCIFNGNYHDTFALELQVKDIHLAYDMAKEGKVPTELLGAMQQVRLSSSQLPSFQSSPDLSPRVVSIGS